MSTRDVDAVDVEPHPRIGEASDDEGADAADEHPEAVGDAALVHFQGRDGGSDVLDRHDGATLELIHRQRRHRNGYVLQALLAAPRGDRDLLNGGGLSHRLGRRWFGLLLSRDLPAHNERARRDSNQYISE